MAARRRSSRLRSSSGPAVLALALFVGALGLCLGTAFTSVDWRCPRGALASPRPGLGPRRPTTALAAAAGGEAAAAGEKAEGSEAEPDRGAAYYAGMFTAPMQESDAEKDMITPNLKLAGYTVGASGAFILFFMGSNGLLHF
mmetsp:Transcript_76716/g.155789  ORF Transcript_76716/g.155789 Transcript_76716/m.155789 type:complete len:142 (+) Transcript_76716:71-496(+)